MGAALQGKPVAQTKFSHSAGKTRTLDASLVARIAKQLTLTTPQLTDAVHSGLSIADYIAHLEGNAYIRPGQCDEHLA